MSKKYIFLIGLLLCSIVSQAFSTNDEEKWIEDLTGKNFLFSLDLPCEEQIKLGLNLIKKLKEDKYYIFGQNTEIVTCKTNGTYDSEKAWDYYLPDGVQLPPDFKENYDKYMSPGSKKNPSLCVGYGCSKRAIKLDSSNKNVILLGLDEERSIMECNTFYVLNAFGLISQQQPKIVTVQFNDKKIKGVPMVLSFDAFGKDIVTWDAKTHGGVGNVSVFNGANNLYDFDYNCKLMEPLVKDFALWSLIGISGCLSNDSLNLIFKQLDENSQKKVQTVCRLLLYDFFDRNDDVTSLFDYQKIRQDVNLYFEDLENSYLKNWKTSLKNIMFLRNTFVSGYGGLLSRDESKGENKEFNDKMLDRLIPWMENIFKIEFKRLLKFFKKEIDETECKEKIILFN